MASSVGWAQLTSPAAARTDSLQWTDAPIASISQAMSPQQQLMVRDTGGTQRRGPAVSPDGHRLAWSAANGRIRALCKQLAKLAGRVSAHRIRLRLKLADVLGHVTSREYPHLAHTHTDHGDKDRRSTIRTARRRCHWTAAAIAALPAIFCAPAQSEETAALRLLRQIQSLQAQHSHLAPELLPPLLELGQLYATGQCDRALDILDLALDVSRRAEGLFNTEQLEIYAPLIHCYLTLDLPAQLDRAQRYVLRIHETQYGPSDPRMLPVLEQAARRYEDLGQYLSARRLQRRALDIATRHAGDRDLSLVAPLRGMARAFRLEYAYGLDNPDLAALDTETTDLKSRATFHGEWGTRLDRLGQRSLERAVDILRSHTGRDEEGAARTERLETLLELADWYQLADDPRNALRLYRELWHEAHVDADGEAANPLDSATALRVRPANGTPLRRTPPERPDRLKCTVDLEYTVTRNGWVNDITVIESNAPTPIQQEAIDDLRRLRFRPRFENGEPIDTPGLHHRSNIYVKRTPPPDDRVARK